MLVRPHGGQMGIGHDWYWISRGYVNVEGDQCYLRFEAEDGITSNEQLIFFETYPNKNLDTRRWPDKYKKAYENGKV
jgi:hypothetical protein